MASAIITLPASANWACVGAAPGAIGGGPAGAVYVVVAAGGATVAAAVVVVVVVVVAAALEEEEAPPGAFEAEEAPGLSKYLTGLDPSCIS